MSQLATKWGRTGDQHAGWTLWYEICAPRCYPAGTATFSPASGNRLASRYLTMVDGQRLRQLRLRRGLSQAGLADKAGISPATVARLERRFRTPCRGRTLTRLAAALGEDLACLTPPSSADVLKP